MDLTAGISLVLPQSVAYPIIYAVLTLMAVLSLFATLFPGALLGIFTDNPEYIRHGTPQMLIACWGYIIYGASEVFLGCLRGMRRSGMPTLLNAFFICLPRLIWVFAFFPLCREVWFLYLCYPISYVLSTTAQGLYFWRVRRGLKEETV
jgi:Na+-driven multidrug efflux pump